MHRCEPYVYAQMIAGRDAPTHGEAKNSWLTGTAAWNFVRDHAVDPRDPPRTWRAAYRPGHSGVMARFTVTRRFRGATYRISVRKQVGLTGRVVELLVDGVRVNGNVVPPGIAGSIVEVDAVVQSELIAAG